MVGPLKTLSPAEPARPAHVLLVEDDLEISRMLQGVLSESGFTVSGVTEAAGMDGVLARDKVDLVVLDIMLPGEDGLSICRRLRTASAIPIIMVTARGDAVDRIVGLEIGADDYLPKPFDSRELVARIRALLRRAQGGTGGGCTRPLRFAGWRIDPASRQLHDPDGLQVAMTSVEFDLLAALCRHPGQVLSRDQLIELTHSGLASPIQRSIDVHASRIRQKIEPDPDNPRYIKTVRLGGYMFTEPVEQA